jgi:AcrR family transcriptional regulator
MSVAVIPTLGGMVRWEPGAPERLQKAALQLFATRGYEQTTATEIAQAVGLTERTFFRHFSDKRDVLFHGQELLIDAFVAGVRGAPADASPIELIACALRSVASAFPDEHRPYARTRHSVIHRNPALRERERHKLASVATAIVDALRERGVGELAATLAAESCVTVFAAAFTHWIREDETRSFADVSAEVLRELVALIGTPAREVDPAS